MNKTILIFVVFLFLLIAGTITVVEKFSEKPVFPRSFSEISVTSLKRSARLTKDQLGYQWRRLTGKLPSDLGTGSEQDPIEKKIIRWQDHDGVWHFTYKDQIPPNVLKQINTKAQNKTQEKTPDQ